MNKIDELEVVVAPHKMGMESAVRAVLPHLRRWEASGAGQTTVILPSRRDFTPSLTALTKQRLSITPRARAGAYSSGPTLAYAPTEDGLVLAQQLAVTGIAVVEWPTRWFDGWARRAGALNVATGDRYEPFTQRQRKLLDDVLEYGNNAWPKQDPLMAVTRADLAQLHSLGVTPDQVAGAMYACGKSRQAVANLLRL